MRRSRAISQSVRLHAVILHRVSMLIAEGDHQEAHDRMDYMEALCLDVLGTIGELRGAEEFAASVKKDLKALPISSEV